MENTALTTIFRNSQGIIWLYNYKRETVGAIYTERLKADVELCAVYDLKEGFNDKYYVYFGGISVFFTYYRKTGLQEVEDVV